MVCDNVKTDKKIIVNEKLSEVEERKRKHIYRLKRGMTEVDR